LKESSQAHAAFYRGACSVLKVLDRMIAEGDYDELHRTIRRQGRHINKIQARRPGARRH
jgi:hypothetical protein